LDAQKNRLVWQSPHSITSLGPHGVVRQVLTDLLISLNAAFSEGHNVTNVTAEPPKEGADRSTREAQALAGARQLSFGAPTRSGQFGSMVNSTLFLSQRNAVTASEGDKYDEDRSIGAARIREGNSGDTFGSTVGNPTIVHRRYAARRSVGRNSDWEKSQGGDGTW